MTVKNRYNEIQSILEKCGQYGCHFLSLLSIAEEFNNEPIDLIEAIKTCQSKGFIDADFYVKAGDLLLEYFTGKRWIRKEVEKLPKKIEDNWYTEAIYFNPKTEKYHYRRRGWDTLIESKTVKEGYTIKYYIWSFK
jgi:hypothetical protein